MAVTAGMAAIIIFAISASACEIGVAVKEGMKSIYQAQDVVVIKVSVFLTHRNCPEGIDTTQFHVAGVEVLGATPWEETSRNHFERFIKVKVLSGTSGEARLEAKRVCSREGGSASIILPVQS